MDVYVRFRGRKGEVQNGKGKAVLHEVGPVTGFQRLGQNIAPQHSSVYEKDLEIAGRSADVRTPDKAFQLVGALLRREGQDLFADLPPVNAVEKLSEIAVSGRVELFLAVDAVMERDARMGQRLALNEVGDIAGFCLRLFEKL